MNLILSEYGTTLCIRQGQRTRGVLSTVILVVMGTLSAILLKLKDKLNAIGVDTSVALIQKRALLGSARILERQIFDNNNNNNNNNNNKSTVKLRSHLDMHT